MSDNEEPVKQKKARKPISPERKKQLILQLKKARERAAEVRKEKREKVQEIKKRKVDEGVKKELAKHKTVSMAPDPRDAEIERLRNQVKNFSLQDIAKKSKPKAKPKKPRPDTPPPPPIENEVMEVAETATIPENVSPPPSPEPKATPKPPPPAPEKPQAQSSTTVQQEMPASSPPSIPVQRPFQAFRRKKHRSY